VEPPTPTPTPTPMPCMHPRIVSNKIDLFFNYLFPQVNKQEQHTHEHDRDPRLRRLHIHKRNRTTIPLVELLSRDIRVPGCTSSPLGPPVRVRSRNVRHTRPRRLARARAHAGRGTTSPDHHPTRLHRRHRKLNPRRNHRSMAPRHRRPQIRQRRITPSHPRHLRPETHMELPRNKTGNQIHFIQLGKQGTARRNPPRLPRNPRRILRPDPRHRQRRRQT